MPGRLVNKLIANFFPYGISIKSVYQLWAMGIPTDEIGRIKGLTREDVEFILSML